jgi:hypothetical protein
MNQDVYDAACARIDKRCLTELDWTFYDAHFVGLGKEAVNISIDEFMRAAG